MELNKKNWNSRYDTKETGWDIGFVSPPLKEYIDQITDLNIKILIPGCGNAYEAEYLFNKGFKNVFIVDYSQIAISNLIKRIPDFPIFNAVCDDFFNISGQYDLILEQTFFCAIDPKLRNNYAKQISSLLKENGKLVGLFFSVPMFSDHPPFGGSKQEYIECFSKLFSINTIEKCYNSIKSRNNKELFFIFNKKE
ncbi:MAG: methyltransferase domain-containing protein [Flavobacteriales bacterium]|jgi:SAM-dependent methyltransferase|tara:strand:- start:4324 stop:4908 length:585 start_codon:yes stop_codon:yes gene_type:complete